MSKVLAILICLLNLWGPTAVSAPKESPLRAALVLYLRFDEPEGVTNFTDGSYMTAHGSCTNPDCPTMGLTGFKNSAADFDGAGDVVTVADDADIDFGSNAFTISMWIYAHNLTKKMSLVDKTDGSDGYAMYIGSTKPLRFTFGRGSAFNDGVSLSSDVLGNNQWHHLVSVTDGTDVNLYVDGTNYGSGSLSSDVATTATALAVGNSNGAGIAVIDFDGRIDDVAIYNTSTLR